MAEDEGGIMRWSCLGWHAERVENTERVGVHCFRLGNGERSQEKVDGCRDVIGHPGHPSMSLHDGS